MSKADKTVDASSKDTWTHTKITLSDGTSFDIPCETNLKLYYRSIIMSLIDKTAADNVQRDQLWNTLLSNKRANGKTDNSTKNPFLISAEDYQAWMSDNVSKAAKQKYYDKIPMEYNGKEYYFNVHGGGFFFQRNLRTCTDDIDAEIMFDYDVPDTSKKNKPQPQQQDSVSISNIASIVTYSTLKELIDNGVSQIVLTGAPGTGKTFLSKQLVYHVAQEHNTLYKQYSALSRNKTDATAAVRKELKTLIDSLLTNSTYYATTPTYSLSPAALDAVYGTSVISAQAAQSALQTDALALRGILAFVQFHPSYDYTDFVEGLRPVEGDNGVSFRRVDGSFKAFCRYVAWRNETYHQMDDLPNYFFLIDEINRADLSKVLGELMFCLEGDKRGKSNDVTTQYSNLKTYFPDNADTAYTHLFGSTFYIPENVVVLGTMNDIDRSVESMDFALRRRFSWIEVTVDEKSLSQAFRVGKFFDKNLEPVPHTTVQADTKNNKPRPSAAIQADTKKRNALLESIRKIIANRVSTFNTTMATDHQLDGAYAIAQGHFQNIPNVFYNDALDDDDDNDDDANTGLLPLTQSPADCAQELLAWVWEYRVQSLLREYLRGHHDAATALSSLQTQWNAPIPAPQTDK